MIKDSLNTLTRKIGQIAEKIGKTVRQTAGTVREKGKPVAVKFAHGVKPALSECEQLSKSAWSKLRPALPDGRDNIGQIILKISCLLISCVMIVSLVWTAITFANVDIQQRQLQGDQIYWNGIGEQETKYDRLKQKYPDFSCWVSVTNTVIDNPVFRSPKAGFYRNHNGFGKYNVYGALYLAGEGTNTVICGNASKDGNLFGSLRNLMDVEYYKSHPGIRLYSRTGYEMYHIFSVLITNTDPKQDGGNLFRYGQTSFDGQADYFQWLQDAARRSVIHTEITPTAQEEVLTLVTDADDFKGAKLVVIAVKRPGSGDYPVTVERASVNPNPYFPEIWYQKHGLQTPWHKE